MQRISDHFKGDYRRFYQRYLQNIKPAGGKEYKALCRFHDDKNASFNFNNRSGAFICHGCDKRGHIVQFYAGLHGLDPKRDFRKILKGIAADFNIPWQENKSRIIKTYDYCDQKGDLLFQVCRMEPKAFCQRRPDGNGGWLWNLRGVEPVLYRLPEVLKSQEVVIVEGEKDADAVASLGYCSTTCPMGAKKWKSTYNETLKGKHVVLIPDNDPEGREHMAQVSASLNGVTASLKLIELPDLPNKGDLSDWLMKFPDKETAAERLAVIIERADLYQVPGRASIEDAILTDGEFLTIELPRKRTILNPWLKEQTISLVPGWRGVGKTWFCMGIVDAATRGESFGPWQIGEPVPCLYVEAEMAAEDVRARFKELNPSLKRKEPLYIYSAAYGNQLGLPAPNLLDEKWRTKMKSILTTRNVKLLVLDNLASLAPGIDENLKKDNDPISQWLLKLRFAGIATIIPHHTNKMGDQRGTSAREDHLDSSITLKTPSDYVPEDGCKFVCHFKKARMRTEDLSLIADCQFQLGLDENGQLKWTWGNVRRETKIEILKLMDEGQRQIEVASILGLSRGYVSKVVKSATKDGILTAKGKLSQSGLRYVQDDQNEEAN